MPKNIKYVGDILRKKSFIITSTLSLLALFCLTNTLSAQNAFNPTFRGKSSKQNVSSSKSSDESNAVDQQTSSNEENSKSNGQSTTTPVLPTYDPFIDNHYKTPPEGFYVGKFGLPVKEVESNLISYGARKHSYAFGKYSKLVLSFYNITLYFDINKRLSSIEVEPKPPLPTIEDTAQDFFIHYFTEDGDMNQMSISISPKKLSIAYIPE